MTREPDPPLGPSADESHGASRDAGRRHPKTRTVLVVGLLVGIFGTVAGMVSLRGLVGYSSSSEGTLVQDFASHLSFARSLLRADLAEDVGASAYSVDTHVGFMTRWTGEAGSRVLPFGYSPTMLWLLLPLSFLSISGAYWVWTLGGAVASGWMILKARFHWIMGLSFFITPVAVTAIALGQTAILGAVGLFSVARWTLDSSIEDRDPAKGWILAGVILWALGAKPPLAISAAAALLALRRFGPVGVGLGLSAVGAVLLTPWLGPAWPADYVALLSSYDRVGIDPVFAWSLMPEHMSNLRAFLAIELGVADDIASRIGNLAWGVSLVGIVTLGFLGRIRKPFIWALAILAYLLFCPHVSSTDELLLVLVPALVVPWDRPTNGRMRPIVWFVVLGALFLTPAWGPLGGVPRWLLFAVEGGIMAWLLALAALTPSLPSAPAPSLAPQ